MAKTTASRALQARQRARRLPSVDIPRTESPELARTLQGIQEHLRMYEGDSGAPKERFVTIAELEAAGLIRADVKQGFGYISQVLTKDVAQKAGSTANPTLKDPVKKDTSRQARVPNAAASKPQPQQAQTGGAGAGRIGGLEDVAVPKPAQQDFLFFDGGKWTGYPLFRRQNVWKKQQQFVEPIKMQEIPAGPSALDGFGYLWTKEGTPNSLWFTDSAGVETQLSSAGGVLPAGSVTDSLLRWSGSSWVEETATRLNTDGDLYLTQGGINVRGGANNTGANAVHAFVDVNGGAARFGGYNWGASSWEAASFVGSSVTLSAQGDGSIVMLGDNSVNVDGFGNYWNFNDGIDVRIYDATNIDYILISHDGTNARFTTVGSGWWLFNGSSNGFLFDSGAATTHNHRFGGTGNAVTTAINGLITSDGVVGAVTSGISDTLSWQFYTADGVENARTGIFHDGSANEFGFYNTWSSGGEFDFAIYSSATRWFHYAPGARVLDYFSGGVDATFRVGRNASEHYGITVQDGNVNLVYTQDESNATTHYVTHNITSPGTAPKRYTWQLDGTEYMYLDENESLVVGLGSGMADGFVVIRLDIDRAWSFKQRGDGANAALDLHSEISGTKTFNITDSTDDINFYFVTETPIFGVNTGTGAAFFTVEPDNNLVRLTRGGAAGDVQLHVEADSDNTVEAAQAALRLSQDGRLVNAVFRTVDNNTIGIGSGAVYGGEVDVFNWPYDTGAVTVSRPMTVTGGDLVVTAGKVDVSGLVEASGGFNIANTSQTSQIGLALYNDVDAVNPTYGIMFTGTATPGAHGYVTGDWATYFTMNTSPGRGWIFYEQGGTGGVASISNDGDMQIDGDFRLINNGSIDKWFGAVGADAVRVIKYPGGGELSIDSSGQIGAIRITYPNVAGYNTMARITIRGYDYSNTGGPWAVHLGGYDNSSGAWNNTHAYTEGNPPFSNVYFETDDVTTQHYIRLGDYTDVWQYPNVYIEEVALGFTNQGQAWEEGWTLALVTTGTGISTAETVPVKTLGGERIDLIDGADQLSLFHSGSAWRVDLYNGDALQIYNAFGSALQVAGGIINYDEAFANGVQQYWDGTDLAHSGLGTVDEIYWNKDGISSSKGIRFAWADSQPWITVASTNTGNGFGDQGAGISVGESGKFGSAAIHMTYNGDGSGYIGMGAVDTTTTTGGRPTYGHLDFTYNSRNILVGGLLYPGNSAGTTGSSLVQGVAYMESADSQNYGSINCAGAAGSSGGYAGWSVNRRLVLMNNNSTTSGVYNDTNNHWFVRMVENNYVELYAANLGALRTQSYSASGHTSGAQVYDHGGTLRDIGFNVLPQFTWNASDTLEARHCGATWGKTNSTGRTLTLAASTNTDFPVLGVVTVLNAFTSGNLTINEGSGTTLYQLNGSTRVDTAGGCTLGPGGVATVYRYSTTVYYIWGTGITP